jgi:cytochrome c oxidase assembly protein subunit 15
MYRNWIKISLVIIYLVIVAGAVVRMTGSGMGCPDWPKCFGYYIPPTEEAEITWKAQQDYFEGQIIVYEESLKVAVKNFTSTEAFDQSNWKKYEKHAYAEFNATHTWIEYINRLLGALSGLAVLIMALLSIKKWKVKKRITLISFFTLVLLLFQAWLGATVVYSELLPSRITIHMLVALVITALLIYLLSTTKDQDELQTATPLFRNLLAFGILISLVQVALGTQVRQSVDEAVRSLGADAKTQWLTDPGIKFYIHRSFSILVVLINLSIWYLNRKKKLGFTWTNLLIIFIGLEVISGISMYYLDFLFGMQALHLVMAALFFGVQFYILMQAYKAKLIST